MEFQFKPAGLLLLLTSLNRCNTISCYAQSADSSLFRSQRASNGTQLCFTETPTDVKRLPPTRSLAVLCGVQCNSDHQCHGYNVHSMTGQCDVNLFRPSVLSVVNGCTAFLSRATSTSTYDTCASETSSQELAYAIQAASNGTILVGVSGDEPTDHLWPAYGALDSLGFNASTVEYRGNFAFVAQVGYKWKTISKVEPQFGNQSRVNVKLTGMALEQLMIQAISD